MEKKYMLNQAHKDLNDPDTDPNDVIQQYGGYVVCGVVSGGRWTINVLFNSLHHESATKLQDQLRAATGSYVKGELSARFEHEMKEEQAHLEYHIKVVGGNTNLSSLDEINEWKESITESTAQVTDFTTTDGLVPIWDFVSDKDRKCKLKESFDNYAAEQMKLLPSDDRLPSILETKYITPPLPYSSSEGLGAKQNLALYGMPDGDGWKYVGHSGNNNTVLALRETRLGYGILKEPNEWQQVWNHDSGIFDKTYYTCWIPDAPPGYVALGMFCRFGTDDPQPPSDIEAKNIVVVHESYVEMCDLEGAEVWNSEESKANYTITLGKLRHNALWPIKNTDPDRPISNISENKWYTLKKLPPIVGEDGQT